MDETFTVIELAIMGWIEDEDGEWVEDDSTPPDDVDL